MIKYKIKLNNGFTLIELMTAVTIAAVIFGFGIASYNKFNDSQKVKQAAITLKNNLRLAQTKAMTGEKPSSCETANIGLVGYELVNTDTSNYRLNSVCFGNVKSSVLDVKLPDSVTTTNFDVTFNVLNQAVTGGTNITLTGLNDVSVTVKISSSGEISSL
jgi:prepilin-type N-terminal cleavage/methylation domain-containing protein